MWRLALVVLVACESDKKQPPPQPVPEQIAPPGTPVAKGNDASKQLTPDEGTLMIEPIVNGAGSIRVTPAGGFHVSTLYPTSLTLVPPEGVTLEKGKLNAADAKAFGEHELAFAVHATAATRGSYEITGTFRFAVCKGEEQCQEKTQPITIAMTAN